MEITEKMCPSMDNPATQHCGRRFTFLFHIPAVNRQHIQCGANALPGGLVQQRASSLRAGALGVTPWQRTPIRAISLVVYDDNIET
ncbi:hypothetical protein [Thiohalomonas denitrificans]|uniref:hypothetical protein n=1 Tax=Thiohalomonas denitrificans TaxID=415747 RepID=UPI0026F06921|nr:hypothetical protein [Thiohalomonas denitrificans]